MGEYKELFKVKDNYYYDRIDVKFIPRKIEIMTNDLHFSNRIKYFKEPKLPIYLNDEADKSHYNAVSCDKNLSKIERFLLLKGNFHTHPEKIKICTRRFALVCVMKTPYYRHNKVFKWGLKATKFQNIIFLNFCEPGEVFKEERQPTLYAKKHFKFQQHCFTDTPTADADDTSVNETEMFYIHQASMKNFDIIYSAEAVGILSQTEISDVRNILKLNRHRFVTTKILPDKSHKLMSYSYSLKLWLQCSLMGATDICIGYNADNGYVTHYNMLQADDLISFGNWNPYRGTKFLLEFLTHIRENMSSIDCPYTVAEYQFDPLKQCVIYKIHHGKTNLSFLSNEFIDEILKKN